MCMHKNFNTSFSKSIEIQHLQPGSWHPLVNENVAFKYNMHILYTIAATFIFKIELFPPVAVGVAIYYLWPHLSYGPREICALSFILASKTPLEEQVKYERTAWW